MNETFIIDPTIMVRDPEDLLSPPQVIRIRSFDDEGVDSFTEDMKMAHLSQQPVIPIVIDSYGGDIYSLFAMVDVIQTSKVKIATIIEGKAMSAGAALFTCGDEGMRYMGPNATLMMHDVSMNRPESKIEDAKVDAHESDRLNQRMWRLMEKNIGKPYGYLWKMNQGRSHTDWYMNAKEARKHNIANHVKIPTLTTTVSVYITLR